MSFEVCQILWISLWDFPGNYRGLLFKEASCLGHLKWDRNLLADNFLHENIKSLTAPEKVFIFTFFKKDLNHRAGEDGLQPPP